MDLKQKYEQYLDVKKESEKQYAVFESKQDELITAVMDKLKSLDVDALERLGVSFSIDTSRLTEPAYTAEKARELFEISKRLNELGQEEFKKHGM